MVAEEPSGPGQIRHSKCYKRFLYRPRRFWWSWAMNQASCWWRWWTRSAQGRTPEGLHLWQVPTVSCILWTPAADDSLTTWMRRSILSTSLWCHWFEACEAVSGAEQNQTCSWNRDKLHLQGRLFLCRVHSSITSRSWVVQECWDLKPCWCWERIWFSSKFEDENLHKL